MHLSTEFLLFLSFVFLFHPLILLLFHSGKGRIHQTDQPLACREYRTDQWIAVFQNVLGISRPQTTVCLLIPYKTYFHQHHNARQLPKIVQDTETIGRLQCSEE